MSKALSNYAQVRLQITEERGLSVATRVMVKPVDASWTLKHTVHVSTVRIPEHTGHWMDLLHIGAADVLGQRLFPE